MNAQRIIWLVTLTWAGTLFGQFESKILNIPSNAVIRLEFEKTDFLIGENIFANYVISNSGGEVLKPSVGGDYRGGTRAHRFKVTATRSDGHIAPDPEPFQWMMGGLSPMAELKTGSNWFEHVRIAHYCEITEPGEYTITVFHDLGWGPKQSNDIRELSARLRFRLPSQKEARDLVAQTLSSKHGGWTWGKRGDQIPDITVLYHPVYLPALVEQAEKGSAAALGGIDSVRTVEGTEALVRFMKIPKGKTANVPTNALLAAQKLEGRLPKPPPRPDWETSEQAAQRLRLQATWHPRFAEPVRQFARSLLLTTNREALLLTANELSVVGRANDFVLLKDALEPAAVRTDTVWSEDHGYPNHQSVARSLAATAFQLGSTNHDFSNPGNGGEALLFLGYLRNTNSTRPKNWEQTSLRLLRDRSGFIRAETAWAIPRPPTERLQMELTRLMTDPDVTVQNWALEALQGFKSPTIRSNVLRVLSSTSDRWLLNTAVSLAMTNNARAEAAEIIAARFNDTLTGPGSAMPHEATMALVRIISDGGHVSGGFRTKTDSVGDLQIKWVRFVDAHRAELTQGKRFKPGDESGFDEELWPGWQFYPPRE